MQVINREVYRWVFMSLFLGMAPVSLLIIGYSVIALDGPDPSVGSGVHCRLFWRHCVLQCTDDDSRPPIVTRWRVFFHASEKKDLLLSSPTVSGLRYGSQRCALQVVVVSMSLGGEESAEAAGKTPLRQNPSSITHNDQRRSLNWFAPQHQIRVVVRV